jgi:hypothetical protein
MYISSHTLDGSNFKVLLGVPSYTRALYPAL